MTDDEHMNGDIRLMQSGIDLPSDTTEKYAHYKIQPLCITQSYYAFQKDIIEALSDNCYKIVTLVRTNPLAEISNIIPIKKYQHFKKNNILDLSNVPSNVNVFTTPVMYFPIERSLLSLGEKHFKQVDRIINKRQIEFDLIHSHFTWSAGYAGVKIKDKYKKPLIVTAHGFDIYHLPFKNGKWREKIEFVLNKADKIITVSQSNYSLIKKLNVTTPVKIIPNGFKSDLFYPRNQIDCRKLLGLPLNNKIILTVGNLFEIKGHKHLIEAIKRITSIRDDITCIIIGSGQLRGALERQIRSLGLEKHVMLPGRKNHDEIPIWLGASDIFVLSSLNEGNPTVMFEALGCGKPFIGTKVGGIPEIIKNEDYGLLVEPGNPYDLAEKLIMSLEKKWNLGRILSHASQFTWENIAKQTMNQYEEVLIGNSN